MALPIRYKGLFSAIGAMVALSPTFAQVYMPDPNLRSWVENQFPGAIDGVFIDQTHPGVANATDLEIINANVSNLAGIGAFGNLQVLVLEGNPLNSNTLEIPASLMSLGMIDCGLSGTLVIATTGEPLHYMQIPQGNYRIAVKHRNHLGAITFATQTFGAGTTTVDIMAAAGTQVNPFAIATATDGTRMLVMGDVTSDKVVKYTGQDNDRDPILQAIGGTIPTLVLAGQYRWEDLNMDGLVKYIGQDNDRDLILQVIGGTTPSNTRGQLPIY